MSKNFHEQLAHEEPPLPSERSTGLVFAAVALIVAYFWRSSETVAYSAIAIAAAFAAVSFTVPIMLRPLNIAWMKLAMVLNKFMSPVIMGILFAVAIIPAGLIMQRGYDPLRRKPKPDGESYWIDREKKEPASSMTNQF